MKPMSLKIALLIAASLVSALPALADEGMGSNMMNQDQQGQKDECLLMAKNCGDQMDSIQQRIGRISHEIDKGSAVYTREELMRLNSELQDARKTLEFLTTNGGA
jgi:hypothetical protein